MPKTSVLFLCSHNSARSQMAEAFLRRLAGDEFEAVSAGLDPEPIHPLTLAVMEEAGYPMEGQRPKALADYMGQKHFGYMIIVCAQAEERCPSTFPGVGQRLFWDIDDPAACEGSREERLACFRQARDEVERRIKDWLAEQGYDVEE